MDFFTKKELNGLKGDLKASEIAIKASNEEFKKKLIEKYAKEMEIEFTNQAYIPLQEPQKLILNTEESTKEKKNISWIKKLFSI